MRNLTALMKWACVQVHCAESICLPRTARKCCATSFPACHAQWDLLFSLTCCLLLPFTASSVKLVKVEWLLACCQSGSHVDTDEYAVVLEPPQEGAGHAGKRPNFCERQVEENEDDIMQLYLGGGAGDGEEQGATLHEQTHIGAKSVCMFLCELVHVLPIATH